MEIISYWKIEKKMSCMRSGYFEGIISYTAFHWWKKREKKYHIHVTGQEFYIIHYKNNKIGNQYF